MSSTKSDSPGGGGPLNEEEETGTIPQPTVEIDGPVTETQSMTREGTEILDARDDVLVLLPEGAEGDIPVVDTEEVSETSDHTEILKHQSLPLEDVPLKRVNPLSGPEEPPPNDLEDLASQAEDDFLSSPEDLNMEPERKPSRPRARRRDLDSPPARSVPEFYPSARDEVRSGPRWKVPLTLAAILALAATAFFTYPRWKHLVEGELTALTGGSAVKTPADPGVPVTKEGSQAGIGKAAEGAKSRVSEEIARASKEAFREKFLLSVELGYVGEVSNE